MSVQAAVVTFPGSNCDYDAYHAFKMVGAEPRFLWHKDTDLANVDVVLLPGGFSYGDYLRAGAIAHLSPIMESVVRFAKAGGPVLGICNGFQILCESGLLPGALLRNRGRLFLSQDVWLEVGRNDTAFTSDYASGQVLRIPIAHADGNYHADDETLATLEGEGRIVFRYCSPGGTVGGQYNPNGSALDIAGITNVEGNVMGMMPHPERAMEPLLGSTDGRALFTSLLSSLVGT